MGTFILLSNGNLLSGIRVRDGPLTLADIAEEGPAVRMCEGLKDYIRREHSLRIGDHGFTYRRLDFPHNRDEQTVMSAHRVGPDAVHLLDIDAVLIL